MAQSPGLIVPDTKFDLAVAPGRVPRPGAAPVGPLRCVRAAAEPGLRLPVADGPVLPGRASSSASLPGWSSGCGWRWSWSSRSSGPRCWPGRSASRSDLACLVVGFAFALSPRMLTTLGPISIEAWPSAVRSVGAASARRRRATRVTTSGGSPVGRGRRHGGRRQRGGHRRRAAARRDLAADPEPWPRRRRLLMLWWPVFTACGTLWWLVPLFTLGAYSPPFLDYIESAGNTTFPTTLVRLPAWHVRLGALRRAELAGRQRPDPRARPRS